MEQRGIEPLNLSIANRALSQLSYCPETYFDSPSASSSCSRVQARRSCSGMFLNSRSRNLMAPRTSATVCHGAMTLR